MIIGVFLESRVTSVKVSGTYFSLSAFYHSCLNTPVGVMNLSLSGCLVFFSVCTCVVHKRCHQQVVTVCPRMKKTAKEPVTAISRHTNTLSAACLLLNTCSLYRFFFCSFKYRMSKKRKKHPPPPTHTFTHASD